MSRSKEINDLKMQVKELETRLDDLENRLPAHSIPPNLISEMDELDEQILALKKQLSALRETE